jgi:hypothetical protein
MTTTITDPLPKPRNLLSRLVRRINSALME